MRVALCNLRVVPIGRDEERVDMRLTGADRLLLDAADLGHRSVELDLARGRDLEPVVDVAAALLEDLEREGEPRRRAADVPEVEPDLEGETGSDHLEGDEA